MTDIIKPPDALFKQDDRVTLTYGQEYLGIVRQAAYVYDTGWQYCVTWISPVSNWHWYPEKDLMLHG